MKIHFCASFLLSVLYVSIGLGQYKPHEDLPVLFTDVQQGNVFSDSKSFVDAIPRYSTSRILEKYSRQKDRKGFNLKNFVDENFITVSTTDYPGKDSFPSIDIHLEELWGQLVRKDSVSKGSLLALPYSYIVPGGRFNEIYYWDSYFTMLGLKQSGKIQLLENMVNNFAFLISTYGFIPNGNRSYYLSRSQPPFFSKMVELLSEIKGDTVFIRYQQQLLKEYAFWMRGAEKLTITNSDYRRVVLVDGKHLLNRYYDDEPSPRPESYKEDLLTASEAGRPAENVYTDIRAAAESGWDFSSRWFENGININTIHTTDIIPVDLNCLLYHLETSISKSYLLSNDLPNYHQFLKTAQRRKAAIMKICWSDKNKFFMDYNFRKRTPTSVYSLAGLFPLYLNLANQKQAEEIGDFIKDHFLFPGGLVTTLTLTGEQWDAPNGWAPLQWVAYQGFKNYQNEALAEEIKTRWLNTILTTYMKNGKMLEKYNVVYPGIPGGGGEYPSQDGFGWTNGVFLQMRKETK